MLNFNLFKALCLLSAVVLQSACGGSSSGGSDDSAIDVTVDNDGIEPSFALTEEDKELVIQSMLIFHPEIYDFSDIDFNSPGSFSYALSQALTFENTGPELCEFLDQGTGVIDISSSYSGFDSLRVDNGVLKVEQDILNGRHEFKADYMDCAFGIMPNFDTEAEEFGFAIPGLLNGQASYETVIENFDIARYFAGLDREEVVVNSDASVAFHSNVKLITTIDPIFKLRPNETDESLIALYDFQLANGGQIVSQEENTVTLEQDQILVTRSATRLASDELFLDVILDFNILDADSTTGPVGAGYLTSVTTAPLKFTHLNNSRPAGGVLEYNFENGTISLSFSEQGITLSSDDGLLSTPSILVDWDDINSRDFSSYSF